MHSEPLIYRSNVVTPWHCGVCYAPLEGYDLQKKYRYCPICGSRIDHPGYERNNWKRITNWQRNEGCRLYAAVVKAA